MSRVQKSFSFSRQFVPFDVEMLHGVLNDEKPVVDFGHDVIARESQTSALLQMMAALLAEAQRILKKNALTVSGS
jgi:hypothetical protein